MPALLRRGRRAAAREAFDAFAEHVEPELLACPRVHRFASPPVLGDPRAPAAALAVCIEPGDGDAGETHDALAEQTTPAAALHQGPLAEVLRETRAEWVVTLQAGDRLAPLALERLGQAARLAPGAAVLTADENALGRGGRRVDPRCFPGPSPDHFAVAPHAPAPIAVRRDDAVTVARGGARERLLRLAGPGGEAHAHVPLLLVHRSPAGRAAAPEAAVVQRVLRDGGDAAARVEPGGARALHVRRPLASEPSVEAIVCFRDRPELLERCARSLLERTGYERLSLRLVDNGSTDAGTAALLGDLGRNRRVTVMADPRPFNFAALNNRAAATSGADLLLFLNNDTEILERGWLEPLLEEAVRDVVGAVAPLLTYANGTVQHAGAAVGMHGWAGHPFAGLRPDEPTPFGAAAQGTRNWLAVSAACLLVERRKFAAVGGFDEGFAVAGNDVDLCLRLTERGWRSLCVPRVRLRHDESASRDPGDVPRGDFERSARRYGAFRTVGDPFYNPNLTLAETTCALRRPEEAR